MTEIRELLKTKITDLNNEQLDKLSRYYDMLVEANTRMNLTTVTSPEEAAEKHFVDSLSALPFIPEKARCIDVGTGAGLPGIPLIVARADINMTLLDSLNKRVNFLREVCAALDLNANLIHARAEDAGRNPVYRTKYDVALSRAVAPLNVLLELTIPFVKIGGVSLCYKGKAAFKEADEAQNAIKNLGCSLKIISVNADYGERYIIVAEKQKPTSAKYPRKAGEPSRKPL